MGTGINAAIPLTFILDWGFRAEYFTERFFDNFDVVEDNGKKLYTIKQELLINNYKPFLSEFYDLIGEELDVDAFPNVGSIDEFKDAFDDEKRNSYTPYIYSHASMFSTLGCECKDYWLFYRGSYKAYLEVYCTLSHFERILAKSMKNPLANAIKFGIFG
jgi:hypothetical protein